MCKNVKINSSEIELIDKKNTKKDAPAHLQSFQPNTHTPAEPGIVENTPLPINKFNEADFQDKDKSDLGFKNKINKFFRGSKNKQFMNNEIDKILKYKTKKEKQFSSLIMRGRNTTFVVLKKSTNLKNK